MATSKTEILAANEHWLLGLVLLTLHGAIWWDFGGSLSRSLMLTHLGLFLIWQPVWRRDQRLQPRNAFIVLVVSLAAIYWLNWWSVFLWLIVLVGLLGGRVLLGRRERYAYLLALVVVISELLFGCVTPMFTLLLGLPT